VIMVLKEQREQGLCRDKMCNFPNLEAEFLDDIQTKVLRVFLLIIHSHLYSFA
jgi:hypothetical protein